MTKRCRIKVTITKIFEAEFEDTPAAARMFKTLEQEGHVAILTGATGDGWKIRHESQQHNVSPIQEDAVFDVEKTP